MECLSAWDDVGIFCRHCGQEDVGAKTWVCVRCAQCLDCTECDPSMRCEHCGALAGSESLRNYLVCLGTSV